MPSGKTKEDLPDTPLGLGRSDGQVRRRPRPRAAAVFVDPQHPDFPPTWLTRHYGILCVGWPGVKPQDFEPGKPIRLDYRVWIHDRQVEPDAAAARPTPTTRRPRRPSGRTEH